MEKDAHMSVKMNSKDMDRPDIITVIFIVILAKPIELGVCTPSPSSILIPNWASVAVSFLS